MPDLLAGKHRVAGPPYISTWNWPAAKQSVAALARLKPEVLACGHGRPMTGAQAAASLAAFSDRFCQQPSSSRPRRGRAAETGRVREPGGPARLPAQVSWRATVEEQTMPLPGDDLVPSPMVLLPARLRGNPRLGIFGELSDSTLLTEPEPGTTRVIRRMRLRCGPWPFRAYVVPIILIWGEAITARNLLRGVKGGPKPPGSRPKPSKPPTWRLRSTTCPVNS